MDSVAAATRRPYLGVLTALAGVVVLGFAVLVLGLSYGRSPLEGVAEPERALALVVSRTLDLAEAVAQRPAWERRLWRLVLNERHEDLDEGIAWYTELAGASLDPLVDLHLAVLRAEAGQLEPVRRTLAAWRGRSEPFVAWADLVDVAYLGADPDGAPGAPAALGELRAGDWFTDRLALGWAARVGDQTLAAAVAAELDARGDRVLSGTRWLVASQAAWLVAGTLVCARLAWRRPARLGPALLPPPWRAREGLVVLVRGGALAALLVVAASLATHGMAEGPWSRVALGVAASLAGVPLIVLASRRLVAPAGVGLGAGLGLALAPGRARALVPVTLVLLAASALGQVAVGLIADGFGISGHWSEWFDPDLAWGAAPLLAATVVDSVVLTPVMEELVFRGVLFATLRRRLPLALAAPVSAAIFALAHGYGLLGFVAVFWSGLVWAVAYEKTGSLLPSIAGHAVDNLGASLSVILALRG